MAFPSFMGLKLISVLRGAASCALFALFGLGAIVLSPLMLLLGKLERCQPVVRVAWTMIAWLFVHLGLIRVDRGNLSTYRGTILAVNHPSLIDVVLITVIVPRLLSVAKRAVGRNPFMGIVARSVAIPGGAENLDVAASYLRKGWNVLVFPEGTRSPVVETDSKAMHPFKRGTAQLALRTGAPVVCVGLRLSRRILAKGQPPWDLGSSPVDFVFRADAPTVERPRDGESLHAAACRVTEAMKARIRGLIA